MDNNRIGSLAPRDDGNIAPLVAELLGYTSHVAAVPMDGPLVSGVVR